MTREPSALPPDVAAQCLFYLDAVAVLFCRAPATLRNVLSTHRKEFFPPRYMRRGSHPRRHRVLTLDDVHRLHTYLALPRR